MDVRFAIHPSVGIARIGNAPEFYLAPLTTGGLPIECDKHGTMQVDDAGNPVFVQGFKHNGRIRRQGARFGVYRYDGDEGVPIELTSASDDVKRIRWTVHLANKKASWFRWHERDGDLRLPNNSYAETGIPLRNRGVQDRRTLVIDPGPRHLTGPLQHTSFSKDNAHGYQATFPEPPAHGDAVTTLGDMRTDESGRLVVIGGLGVTAGSGAVTHFTGADGWFDDLADGPVTCELELKNGDRHVLGAWCIVAQPKFAPQLVNVVTLDDVMFDVAVQAGSFPQYRDPAVDVDFDRDVAPIFARFADGAWVANIPSMAAFARPYFNVRDPSPELYLERRRYARFFRATPDEDFVDGVPMMPLGVGENALSNAHSARFLTLTATQRFVLDQWVNGRFTTGLQPLSGVHPLDRASVGNCVGSPLSPGVEVTWSISNPNIYEAPWRIKHRHPPEYYVDHGLDLNADETATTAGAEPGDLTKRMNVPWQADFFQCTMQFVSLHAGDVVDSEHFPLPPAYYAFWWPAQSPVQVISGALSVEEQAASGVPAGAQVPFARGLNSFDDAIAGWTYLGFVVNQNRVDGNYYPYFVEAERNHDQFVSGAVAFGRIENVQSATDVSFSPVFSLKQQTVPPRSDAHRRRGVAVRF